MADQHIYNGEGIHSECKRVEEALQESEEKLRILFESISDGILVSDLEGQIIDVNEAAIRLLGCSDKVEAIGQPGFEFIAEKDRARAAEDAMQAIELGYGPAYEYTFVAKDGREYDAEASASLLLDGAGNTLGFISIFRDITERKRAEEALRESEEKLRVMFESTREGITITDLKGKILDVNDAILRMSGLGREELIGQKGFKLVPPEDSKNIIEQGMKAVKSETVTEKMSYETTPTSGRAYDVDLSISVLRDSSGDSTGFVAITRDITEHKESESRYRLLAENVTDIIWTMDMNLQFTYLSPSIRRLGYSVEEAVALSLDRILTPGSLDIVQKVFIEEMAVEELDAKRREGAISSQDVLNLLAPDQRDAIGGITIDEWLAQRKVPWSKHRMRILEVELYRKDGSTVCEELAVGFVRDSDSQPAGIVGIARDISDRKKAEEEKLRAVTEKAAVLDSMGEGLLIVGMEGKVISCNPAFERLCGYTQGDLIGEDAVGLINVLVKAEDQQRLMTNFATALETNIVGTEYFSLISRDGREIPVATAETLVLDEEGNPTAIIAMFTDITNIRQAEAARWGSEEKLRCFMDSATDQFTIWDSELNLVDLNEAALKYPLIRLSDEANKPISSRY